MGGAGEPLLQGCARAQPSLSFFKLSVILSSPAPHRLRLPAGLCSIATGTKADPDESRWHNKLDPESNTTDCKGRLLAYECVPAESVYRRCPRRWLIVLLPRCTGSG